MPTLVPDGIQTFAQGVKWERPTPNTSSFASCGRENHCLGRHTARDLAPPVPMAPSSVTPQDSGGGATARCGPGKAYIHPLWIRAPYRAHADMSRRMLETQARRHVRVLRTA